MSQLIERLCFVGLLLMFGLALTNEVLAIPQTINVHGKLTDDSGSSLSGTYAMNFSIYDVYTGDGAIWSVNGTSVVTDSDGIYTIILRDVDLNFSLQYYLGIAVGTDGEMTPRINLTTAPYSFRTQNISIKGVEFDDNVDIGGMNLTTTGTGFFGGLNVSGSVTATNFYGGGSGLTGISSASSTAWTNDSTTVWTDLNVNITGDLNASNVLFISEASGRVGIGTDSPTYALDVYGSTTDNVARFMSTDSTAKIILEDNADIYYLGTASGKGFFGSGSGLKTENIILDSSGNVGIGTSSPTSELEVVGGINVTGNVTAANFYGDGSGLTGVSSSSTAWTNDSLKVWTDLDVNITGGLNVSENILAKNFKTHPVNGSVSIGSNTGPLTDSYTLVGTSAGGGATGSSVTAVGRAAGYLNTGTYLTAVGREAGYENTGSYLTAMGYRAGFGNTQGLVTAIGREAGYLNTGSSLTALGYYAGRDNTGSYLTALGYTAGYGNTGSSVTAIGHQAGQGNNGTIVTAVGQYVGKDNTGNQLIALGYYAGKGNTANDVVAIGYQAGLNNTVANRFILKQNNINTIPLITGDFSAGSVGINMSSTPAQALNVIGDLNVTGTSYLSDLIISADNITVNNIISKDGNITFSDNNNVERMRVTSGGRVGIGTTAPTSELHILNTAASADFKLGESAAKETTIRWDYTNDRAEWDTYGYSYPIYLDASNIVLQSQTSGSVGINTTDPSGGALSIEGSINATGTINATTDICITDGSCLSASISPSSTAWTNDSNTVWTDLDVNITGGLNVSENAYFGGKVGIGNETPDVTLEVQGTYNQNQVLFTSDGENGLFFEADGGPTHYNWHIGQQDIVGGLDFTPSTAVGGTTFTTPAMVILTNSKVGIGVTSPLLQSGGLHINSTSDTELKLSSSPTSGNEWTLVSAGGAQYGVGHFAIREDLAGVTPFFIHRDAVDDTLVLGSSGNVGINTTDPSGGALSIEGSINATGTINATTDICITDGSCLSASVSPSSTAWQNDSNTVWTDLDVNITGDLNASNVLFVSKDSGRVGIGTDSPDEPLEVSINEEGGTGVAVLRLSNQFAGDNVNWDFLLENNKGLIIKPDSGAADLHLKVRDYAGVYIDGATGNVGIGTNIPGRALEVNATLPLMKFNRAGGYAWEIGVDDGTYADISDFIIRDTSKGVRMIVEATTGYVGIGTTVPEGALTVNGSLGVGEPDSTVQASHYVDILSDSTYGGTGESALRVLSAVGGALTNTEIAGLAHRDGAWTALYAKQGSANSAIYANGSVGIGTTSPTSELEVVGGVNVTGNVTAANFYDIDGNTIGNGASSTAWTNDSNMVWTELNVNITGSLNVTDDVRIGSNVTIVGGKLYFTAIPDNPNNAMLHKLTTGLKEFKIISSNSGTTATPIYFHTREDATADMVINNSGNVGIGTVNPLAPLHIQQDGTANPSIDGDTALLLSTTAGAASSTRLNILSGNAAYGQLIFGDTDADTRGRILYKHATDDYMAFYVANSEKMRILSSGNIGIGSAAPGNKLDVEGSINATGTINATTDICITDGNCLSTSATSSSTAWTNDSTTVWTDLAVNTTGDLNASNVLFVSEDSGRVGIGTDSPASKLHVFTSGASVSPNADGDDFVIESSGKAGLSILTAGSGSDGLIFFGSGDTTSTEAGWRYQFDDATGGKLLTRVNNADRIAIDGSGNVGIGTTSPTSELEVVGGVNVTGNVTAANFYDIDGNVIGNGASSTAWTNDSTKVWTDLDVNITGGLNVSENAYFGGKVGINQSSPDHFLHINGDGNQDELRLEGTGTSGSGARITFGDVGVCYLEEYKDDYLRIYANTLISLETGELVLDANAVNFTGIPSFYNEVRMLGGSVGIGTITPTSEVNVVGGINVTGNVTAANFYDIDGNVIGNGASSTAWTNDSSTVWTDLDVNITGDLNVTEDLTVLGNVGIGTDSPSDELEISGSTTSLTFDGDLADPVINSTAGGNVTITSDGGTVIIKLG